LDNDLVLGVIMFAVVVPSIVLHEVAHGLMAYRLGDPTAKEAGRLSLNPIKHVDPFGTVLLPLLLSFTAGWAIGYAKPVPINPRYFPDYRRGMALTGLAGPATNAVLAIVAALGARAAEAALVVTGAAWLEWVWLVLFFLARINLVLIFFNLIPIPPLDGSRIIPLFLNHNGLTWYHRVEQYGIPIVLILAVGLPWLTNGAIDPIDIYFGYTVDPLIKLLVGV
jgi:Zn-dependent protease